MDEPRAPGEAIASVIRRAESGESDVRALGEQLWFALTGETAYDGSVPQLAQSGSLSVALNRILRTSLTEDPAHGYASAEAMAADLRRASRLGEEPLAVAEPAEDPEPQRATGVWLLVIAVTVVVILLVGGLLAPSLIDTSSIFGGDSSSTSR